MGDEAAEAKTKITDQQGKGGPGFKVVDKVEHRISMATYLGGKSETNTDRKEITKRNLCMPLDGFVLSNVLSATECNNLLDGLRKSGHNYTFWNPEAPNVTDTRNVDTVEIYDQTLANEIWNRVKDNVTKHIDIPKENDIWEYGLEGRWVACGINPRLLFARYSSGGHFSPHTDGHNVIDFNTRSLHSVIIYLNDCKEGGGTQMFYPIDYKDKKFVKDAKGRFRFDESKVADKALCRSGSMLSFSQHIMHEGEPVGEGCVKYIIRTDVMYVRTPKVCTSEKDLQAYDCYIKAGEAESRKEYDSACNL